MVVELGQQGISFLCSVCLGAVLALLYDGFRVLRRLKQWSTVAVAVQDVCYWSISTVAAVLIFYAVDNLALRGWYLLGAGLGVAFYLAALSPVVLFLGERLGRGVVYVVRHVCTPVAKLLLWPLHVAGGWCKHLQKPVRAMQRWGRYQLKRLQMMGHREEKPKKK